MTWRLRVGSGLSEIADDALDEAVAARGMEIGVAGVVPRAGSFATTLIRDRVAVGEPLQLETGGGVRVWSGSVYDVFPEVDPAVNDLRYALHGDGIIARIATANAGMRTPVYSSISVDAAISHVLDLIDLPAADRDIGSSPRVLARWWLAEDVAPWDALLRLVRTAGARARIYEDAVGRLAFRDVALASVPDHTAAGRDRATAADATVSRLDRVESGLDRIVNSVAVGVTTEPGPAGPIRVAAIEKADFRSGVAVAVAEVSVTQAELDAAGVLPDDLVIAFFGAALLGGSGTTETIPQNLTLFSTPDTASSGNGNFHAGWRRGPAAITYSRRRSSTPRGVRANMVVVAYRSAGDPTGVADGIFGRGSSNSTTPPLPVPSVPVSASDVVVSVLQSYLVPSNNPSPRLFAPSTQPAGFAQLNPSGASDLYTLELVAADGFPGGAQWTFQSIAVGRIIFAISVLFGGNSEVIWSPNSPAFLPVAAGRRIIYQVTGASSRPFAEIITPSIAAGDYAVTGTVAVTAQLNGVKGDWLINGGASGGSVTLSRLRGTFLDGGGQHTVETINQASIAAFGLRPNRADIWPYLTTAGAQQLAIDLVAHSAFPRRSWELVLDADRNPATEQVALGAAIGQVVRANIDAAFDHLGEVVGIAHRISGPAGLLQTTLKMLAAETALPVPNPLYLNSTANPIALDDPANPTELR